MLLNYVNMFIQGPMEDHYLLVNGLPCQKIINK